MECLSPPRSVKDGVPHAFIAAAVLATVAGLVALAVLPSARPFLAKLRLSPSAVPIH